MSTPNWLPDLVNINGEPHKVFAMLYDIFDADFRRTSRQFLALPLWWDSRVVEPPYEEGFWHLITRKHHGSGERLLDFRRAERLPWCGPTITNCTDGCVKVWDYEEGDRRVRTHLWLQAYDYVVILEKRFNRRGAVAFLVTAFHVDGNQKRADLQRKYLKRRA